MTTKFPSTLVLMELAEELWTSLASTLTSGWT